MNPQRGRTVTDITMKHVRQRYGLSQQEMARLMGMRQQSVSRIETGERSETLQHLAFLRVLDKIYEESLAYMVWEIIEE